MVLERPLDPHLIFALTFPAKHSNKFDRMTFNLLPPALHVYNTTKQCIAYVY